MEIEIDLRGEPAQGQLDLLCRARPIERAVADPATPERVRLLLKEVPSIKQFGVGFGLTPTSSYQTYVALERARVVYVTSASQPLAFKCRCLRERVEGTLAMLGTVELDEMIAEGHPAEVVCNFCASRYQVERPALERIRAEVAHGPRENN